jgi:hypothetical protein
MECKNKRNPYYPQFWKPPKLNITGKEINSSMQLKDFLIICNPETHGVQNTIQTTLKHLISKD